MCTYILCVPVYGCIYRVMGFKVVQYSLKCAKEIPVNNLSLLDGVWMG
jgi:hypothetical protein